MVDFGCDQTTGEERGLCEYFQHVTTMTPDAVVIQNGFTVLPRAEYERLTEISQARDPVSSADLNSAFDDAFNKIDSTFDDGLVGYIRGIFELPSSEDIANGSEFRNNIETQARGYLNREFGMNTTPSAPVQNHEPVFESQTHVVISQDHYTALQSTDAMYNHMREIGNEIQNTAREMLPDDYAQQLREAVFTSGNYDAATQRMIQDELPKHLATNNSATQTPQETAEALQNHLQNHRNQVVSETRNQIQQFRERNAHLIQENPDQEAMEQRNLRENIDRTATEGRAAVEDFASQMTFGK